MKQRFKVFLSAALAAVMAVSAAAFAACDNGGEEDNDNEVYEEDMIVPINIQDDYAADKVVTEGFSVGSVTEDKSAFTLPQLVADNMLMQANVTAKVWGKTTESGSVAVQIIKPDNTVEATYYGEVENGAFTVYVGGHDYGKGYTLRLVAESGKSVSLKDVAFGELWIGGGQSNMGWQMDQCYRKTTSNLLYKQDIEKSANEEIRLFRVYNHSSQTPVNEVANSTGWNKAAPASVAPFSAAGYFFARELNARYKIPVGFIMSCVGGTGIHTWLPEGVLSDAVGTCSPDASYTDSSYFNGMIYPLRNLTVRGVLWYQGEGDHNHYDVNYGLLMKGWRETFGRDNIWFTTVTLPRYFDADSYFLCREQQMAASVKDRYATYSVNIDCGLLPKDIATGDDLNEPPTQGIHPYDKKPIGQRAAHVTMQDLYGAKGVWSGPKFKSAQVSGNKVVITFSNVGKGLALRGKFGFEIADRSNPEIYREANVRIVASNKIEVYAEGVSNPVKIVYGRDNGDLEKLESFADCVCLYNTKDDGSDYAYPAEQFVWSKN